MNFNDLRAEIARADLTIPKLADKLGMDKNTLYSRMRGRTPFNQKEILAISSILRLSNEKIMNIFFAEQVS